MAASPSRRWISFEDDDGSRWLFDATFLWSSWRCVFGDGCRGIVGDDELGAVQGCCSFGAHLIDDDDRENVAAAAERLPTHLWQNRSLVATEADLFVTDEDGDEVTATAEGACIFLNGPDFPTGSGCALHFAAAAAGESFIGWKPEVCWQLPLRLEELEDDNRRSTFVLRPWDTQDWGPEGVNFAWWCTADPHAYSGTAPVIETLRDEIETLVGEAVFDRLLGELEAIRHLEQPRNRSEVPVALFPRR